MDNPPPTYSPEHRRTLLRVAARSLTHGITARRPLTVNVTEFDEPLRQLRGTFVTLRKAGRLRGCMGTLQAKRPLVEDVAYNAHASAARDPRFEAVTADEVAELSIHVSVLSAAEPIAFSTIDELFAGVRPGLDGLIVRSGGRSATLLPAVWEKIPDMADFWVQLLAKAGLPADYWDDDLAVSRYTTESFGGKLGGDAGT